MKKLIFTTLLFVSVISMTAQITVNRNDLIVSGQVLVQGNDSNFFKVQTGGANKTWDFSSLKATSVSTLKFNPPQWYPGNTYFPNSNLALINSSEDSNFVFLKINNTELSVEGTYNLLPDTFEVSPFQRTILTFPSTYNTNYSQTTLVPGQTFPFGVDIDSTGPLPMIDSVRFSTELKFKSNIDGWGSIITPLGTFNTLMQNMRTITGAKLEMYANNTWNTISPSLAALLGFPSFPSDTSYQHQFWTNDATVGFPLVSYDFGQGEDSASSIDWLQTKPQTNGIASTNVSTTASLYPNPCHNNFQVQLPANTSAQLSIMDLSGRTVKTMVVENNAMVDISDLSNGAYTVKYSNISNGSTMNVLKIIKF